ncbi:MAG: type II toxin-antitoxin system prevent-host-death family antitoxin [Alphaproteobacteria bacterium]|nr:type II toxin-antitoxin system prevent-host-death family antitoxin [Alphaproteobacteria bacterium]
MANSRSKAKRRFTLTDLAHRSGEVAEAAYRGPVEITKHGKRAFVLIAADEFDALRSAAPSRRAIHSSLLKPREADKYAQALETAAAALDHE